MDDKQQRRAQTNRELDALRQRVVERIVHDQANAIDAALAGMGMVGRVTGGELRGDEYGPTHAQHLWTPDGARPTMQQVGRLSTVLPTGAIWHYAGGGSLEITLLLEG